MADRLGMLPGTSAFPGRLEPRPRPPIAPEPLEVRVAGPVTPGR